MSAKNGEHAGDRRRASGPRPDGAGFTTRPAEVIDAPASAGEELGAPNARDVGLRRSRRRSRGSHRLFSAFAAGSTFASPLPFWLALAGAATAYLVSGSIAAAIVALVTASLATLSAQILAAGSGRMADPSQPPLRSRFEELEDLAWELRESEERYRSQVQAFGDLMVLRDSGGTILYCNDAYANAFGLEPGDLRGSLFRPQPVSGTGTATGAAAALGAGAVETAFDMPEGRRWYAWLDMTVREGRDGSTAMLSVARDITAFKLAEATLEDARAKAEQASGAKSRFLATVSHEMRTPLNGILGMSSLLASTRLTAEQKTYVSAMESSGRSLLALIEDMLDITMIEAGRFEPRMEEFDLRELLTGVIELLAPRAYGKELGLGLFIDPALPESVISDPGRLRQVVVNLAGNAVKFTQRGGVAIACSAVRRREGDGRQMTLLRFEVRDTGPGLADGDRQRIFEEFERVGSAVSRKSDGAGLGLSISRAIAGALGGSIGLERTSPRGSIFYLEVPVTMAGDGTATQDRDLPPRDSPPRDSPLAGRRVVLVSTSGPEADSLARQLRAFGAIVRRFAASQAALSYLSRTPVDAVLFEPSGSRTPRREIRRLSARARGRGDVPAVPVIMLLRPQDRQELSAYRKEGATGYLIRPVRPQSLVATILGLVGAGTDNGEWQDGMASGGETTDAPVDTGPAEAPPGLAPVLLAEDNDINALLAGVALRRAGAAMVRAVNGKEAVRLAAEAIRRCKPHAVILMDMHMPVMDGIEAVRRIRALEAGSGTVPSRIIGLTADEQGETRQAAIAAGIDDFLVKPVDPLELAEIIRRPVAGRHSSAA